MINKEKRYIVKPLTRDTERSNPEMLRLILCKDYLQLDFGYAAPWIYARGGWIHIASNTYARVHGSEKQYKLIDAKNIPFAPKRFKFQSTADWTVFTLYFEPIPIKDCIIDIIEKEKPSPNDFNYYNITLQEITAIEVME